MTPARSDNSYLARWIARVGGSKALVRSVVDEARRWMELSFDFPNKVKYSAFDKLEKVLLRRFDLRQSYSTQSVIDVAFCGKTRGSRNSQKKQLDLKGQLKPIAIG